MVSNKLTNDELKRYARHISLNEIGLSGQQKIKNARILIIGVGGLGCPAALYLAAAGIGTIGLVENDVIEESNLHRQILFGNLDVGRKKIHAAADKLLLLAPQLNIEKFPVRLTQENAVEIISKFDIVIDSTDNFEAKYLINDLCHVLLKPLIYASINQFDGQLAVFDSRFETSFNYRDLFPSKPPHVLSPNCAEAGVIGVLPGLFGCMQANETIKLICDIPSGLSGKLLCMDSITLETRLFNVKLDYLNPLRRPGFTLHDVTEEKSNFINTSVQQLEVTTFLSWLKLKKQFQLIDVRSDEERQVISYGGLHVPLINVKGMSVSIRSEVPLVFYCASGNRSTQACAMLESMGLGKNSYSLKGGVMELMRQNTEATQIFRRFDQHGVLIAT
ncbi:HesA/MoeB/ThiF family protein [Glaciimonas immobilis]|uniref:Molybdopterin-synthase adenylyltransferase n=1 Tax=Glaciimonas immobilis TaxID=728004 RepID=A0A840RMS8_9BURK|nr:HesA/MoeB/ThiF family protein [Glaciimonas immobilis]KAF3996842.1 hypothetical protein HAV38_16790 [Glaciimonas immobilis]MBB5199607.1 adenylyltransferase/sulfurtransferase [Glaciimonas immobilis]